MKPEDTQNFFDAWDQCAELYGKPVSSDAKELAFKLLANYPLNQIKRALQLHMTDPDGGRFMPKPADVVGKIRDLSHGMFPGAEQAWAEFPRNESQTACICDAMAEAWAVACELDPIAGRMAFKEVYARAVSQAIAQGKPPKWFISAGSDKNQRDQVVMDSIQKGLISPSVGRAYLPHVPAEKLHQLSQGQATTHQLIEASTPTVNTIEKLVDVAPETVTRDSLNKLRAMLGSARR